MNYSRRNFLKAAGVGGPGAVAIGVGFGGAAALTFVAQAFRVTGARRLIHGHTHRPGVHPGVVDGVQTERVVLAPWYEAASYLAVDATGVREIPLP